MLREIVLDTETTGLDPRKGDRLIEIGCIELVNRIPTGQEFHRFINPERSVPAEAEAVHGISTAFLVDKPVFSKVAGEFLEFIGQDALVIHNATFDVGFLNMELERLKHPAISMSRVVDTLQLARRKHPAGPNSLDALCKRYGIDNSKRIKHGALMDSLLLAEVYVELLGERQASFGLQAERGRAGRGAQVNGVAIRGPRPVPLEPRLTAELIAAHRAFVETLGPKALWKRYFAPDDAAKS
ncbi:MAG: DNA polymerase III subunit epsilon [Hyphomicrobium zavarzinii]|jgi:DNA polymerase-3 subunit epsilon|uniref:DNA polymerase III subunit epsilon n=1 Tax=Hyphomicrobium TaxID=81 RepID=UPI00036E26CA|nr:MULTISPECIES: DNA polymerase III subunit epsilon [Hyphomicrobium]MBL8844987.1 DNA polymerase III subunit epsilon [Hyphomicrobium zavarzinii]WBT38613.1 DNA polymerase III subunit epsilon [Hyphomicrobium sp. DMF-1]HML44048.1 DNA polymerase III subunit epsilon [Hyphomicrobium zavarzinii]